MAPAAEILSSDTRTRALALSPANPLERWATRLGPSLLLAATFVGMAIFSWGKWPDVLVDFGAELYTPWKLSEGQALGRDIAWGASGPLSPYLNALLFWVFGPSLRVLVLFNLGLLALLTWLLFTLLGALFDRVAATVGALVFLTVFAFGQYVGVGNFNYVTPYTHGATHGMLLALLAILLLYRFALNGSRRSLGGAGFVLGSVFLTKPEIFAACAGALCVGLLAILVRRTTLAARARIVLVFVGAALVPVIGAFALLLIQLPPRMAWQVTAMPWILILNPRGIIQNSFYLSVSGLDAPTENLMLLLQWAAFYGTLLISAFALDRFLPRMLSPRFAAGILSLGALVCLVALVPAETWVEGVARPFPGIVLVGGVAYAALLFRGRGTDDVGRQSKLLLGLILSAFSLALLSKMILNAKIYHYGFVLAMPAALLVVGWLVHSIPGFLRVRGARGAIFRGVALAALVASATGFVVIASERFARKVYPVGSGADAFLADIRGQYVSEMILRLAAIAPSGATLAVLPEGVMVNYLSRRTSPTGFLDFMPNAVSMLGSDAPLLDALRSSHPDFILLAARDSTEHGARFFGRDYARHAASWINKNYEPVWLVGAVPFESSQYGLLLMARVEK